jgi:hypothetical protein
MTAGHAGEWIAAQVFDLELAPSAVMAAYDGHFRTGPLIGKTVNVKWYLKQEGMLESRPPTLSTLGLPDRRHSRAGWHAPRGS